LIVVGGGCGGVWLSLHFWLLVDLDRSFASVEKDILLGTAVWCKVGYDIGAVINDKIDTHWSGVAVLAFFGSLDNELARVNMMSTRIPEGFPVRFVYYV
jgi:hypothetical protein